MNGNFRFSKIFKKKSQNNKNKMIKLVLCDVHIPNRHVRNQNNDNEYCFSTYFFVQGKKFMLQNFTFDDEEKKNFSFYEKS